MKSLLVDIISIIRRNKTGASNPYSGLRLQSDPLGNAELVRDSEGCLETNPGGGRGGVEAGKPLHILPPINPGKTKRPFMYEDELPEDISQEDYDTWFEKSFVDFVRIGPVFNETSPN